jgi:hypothetical protein
MRAVPIYSRLCKLKRVSPGVYARVSCWCSENDSRGAEEGGEIGVRAERFVIRSDDDDADENTVEIDGALVLHAGSKRECLPSRARAKVQYLCKFDEKIAIQ